MKPSCRKYPVLQKKNDSIIHLLQSYKELQALEIDLLFDNFQMAHRLGKPAKS